MGSVDCLTHLYISQEVFSTYNAALTAMPCFCEGSGQDRAGSGGISGNGIQVTCNL